MAAGGAPDGRGPESGWRPVRAGQRATPSRAPGPFTATWKGQVAAELRADFTFHAEFNGDLKLTVNDTVVLEGKGEGDKPVTGKSIRLNKGANQLVAEFKSPAAGDAFVRLFWSNKETPYNPIPITELTHPETDDLKKALLVRRGRDLFVENRCAKCHTTPGGMPELAMDAPSFDGIGGRRNFDWLARWIADPHALRPGTPMPQVLSGADAKDKAGSVAAYLSSLKGSPIAETKPGDIEAGKALYEKLHCIACHNPPDVAAADMKKISQKQVKAKFAPGALVAFLLKPSEHYAWIRMPGFKLTAEEAQHLGSYLEASADKPTDRPAPTDDALLNKGQPIVQPPGCLNCHVLAAGTNGLPAKPPTDPPPPSLPPRPRPAHRPPRGHGRGAAEARRRACAGRHRGPRPSRPEAGQRERRLRLRVLPSGRRDGSHPGVRGAGHQPRHQLRPHPAVVLPPLAARTHLGGSVHQDARLLRRRGQEPAARCARRRRPEDHRRRLGIPPPRRQDAAPGVSEGDCGLGGAHSVRTRFIRCPRSSDRALLEFVRPW